MPDKSPPLSGFRVLDLTNVLAGPFCCHQLAHLGADVIKVEIPGSGDLARQLGADPELNEALMGVSFLAQNTGKRSITLNLKHESGKAILKRLVTTANVLVENFRPGVMDRLGVGYEVLKSEQPDLIYCAISGFGQDGPMKNLPAYDQIIQGLSGVMSITGTKDAAPLRVGYPMADTIGGLTAAFAIASALASPVGQRGRFVDVSMLESVIATMGWVVSNHLIAGQDPEPMGNDNFTASPSGAFQTGDGVINIAANKQEQFEALCDVVERPDLKEDKRFNKRLARLENRSVLKTILEEALSTRTARQWSVLLNDAGVPAGIVLSVPEVLASPQIAGRELVEDFPSAPGVDREVRVVRTGVKLNGEAPSVDRPPPSLGEHTDAILKDLGYDEAEVETFRREGVV